ncbi:MAG: DUF2723 domain-containing protein [Chloroflexota bacterium]
MVKLIAAWKPNLPGHTDRLLAPSVGVLALIVYLRTVAPSLLEGDPSELAVVSYVLGISHPTGYPLFTLLGHLFTLLPGADVAGRLNLMAALVAAGVVPLVYILARQLGVGPFGAALAATAFAFTKSFWATAVRTDVHSLNALFVVLSTGLLLRWARELDREGEGDPGLRKGSIFYLLVFAFVYGLSLTNHITACLLAPGFLIFFLIAGRSFWRRPARLLLPAIAFLLPLLLYLYVPIRGSRLLADPVLAQDPAGIGIPQRTSWGLVSPHYRAGGWQGFTNLVFAGDYSRGLLSVPWAEAPARLATLPGVLERQFGPWGISLALLGLVSLARRRPRDLTLLGIIFLTIGAQITRYGEQDIVIFLIPAYLVIALWMGMGAEAIFQAGRRWLQGRVIVVGRLGVGAALLLLPAGELVNNYRNLDHSQDRAIPQYAQDVLNRNLPPGAVVLGDWDAVTPLRYRQVVDGQRRDLVVVHAGMGSQRFYDILERCRRTARPAYLLELFPSEERDAAPTRFPRKVTPLPLYGEVRPQYLAFTNIAGQVALLGYDLEPQSLRPGGALHLRLYWLTLEDLKTDYEFFVRLIAPDSRIANQIQRPPVSPWFPTSRWRRGQVFSEETHLLIPARTPPGAYNLEVGWRKGTELLPLLRQGSSPEAGPIVLRQMMVGP